MLVFELSAKESAVNVFPCVDIKGYFFHFSQGILNTAQGYDLLLQILSVYTDIIDNFLPGGQADSSPCPYECATLV